MIGGERTFSSIMNESCNRNLSSVGFRKPHNEPFWFLYSSKMKSDKEKETQRVLADLQHKHWETLNVSISGLQTLARVFLPSTDKSEQQEAIQQTGLWSPCSLMGCIDDRMQRCVTYKLHPIHYDTICWSSLKQQWLSGCGDMSSHVSMWTSWWTPDKTRKWSRLIKDIFRKFRLIRCRAGGGVALALAMNFICRKVREKTTKRQEWWETDTNPSQKSHEKAKKM